MRLAEQWQAIQRDLPEAWSDARLALTVSDAGRAERAAALLVPLLPARRGSKISFLAATPGAGPSPGAVARALARLDEERIEGRLELLASGEPVVVEPASKPTLAASWDAELEALAPDWSDVYAELGLRSTDDLDRAALLSAPLNPARYGPRPGFRFRCAARFGYGASPGMVRRCLERLDADGIRGEIHILRTLSDTKPVATQGPVWYVGGKPV